MVSLKNITDSSEIYYDAILEYEDRTTYTLKTNGGEPFLTKYDLYGKNNLPNKQGISILIKWILFYCDGNNSLVDIAEHTGYDVEDVESCVSNLLDRGVIKINE